MTIALRDDVTYILLKKIKEGSEQPEFEPIQLKSTDFAGIEVTTKDLLGHLDYLNQEQFIDADFSGDAYGGPDPVPPLVTVTRATLNDKGRQLFEKIDANPPQSLQGGTTVPIASENMAFLEKVKLKAQLEDIFDARDIAEVVFRTMRDMMPTQEADKIAAELHEEAVPTNDKTLQNEVATLWKDTNPLVRLLSRIRPPLDIDSETFLRRVRQEGGLQRGIDPEMAVQAVFSATKDELSGDRIQEISGFLPDRIQSLWQSA